MSPPAAAGSAPVEVVAGIVVRDGRLLVTRRTAEQSFASLWEIPGGKMEPGETPSAALARELREELGVTAAARAEYFRVRHRNSDGREVRIRFLRAEIVAGEPRPLEVAEVKWAGAEDLRELRFIPHDEPVVRKLAEDLAAGRL